MSLKKYKKIILSSNFCFNLLSFILFCFIKFIHITSFITYKNTDKLKKYMNDGKPVILIFWHSRSLLISKFWKDNLGMRKNSIYGIFSSHKDGRLIGKIFGLLGVKNVISNSKSVKQTSSMVLRIVNLLRKGHSIGFTPDGPIGPRMNFVSDSAFLFAKLTGAPIVPVYISSKDPKILNSWDRYIFSKPFHKAIIEVGDFIFVDKNSSREEIENLRKKTEMLMQENTLALDKSLNMPIILPERI